MSHADDAGSVHAEHRDHSGVNEQVSGLGETLNLLKK
jgi:hypothetical protein